MKQYLLKGIILVLLSFNANATENPFDIQQNFKQIETQEKNILSDLEKIAEATDEFADDEGDDNLDNEIDEPEPRENSSKAIIPTQKGMDKQNKEEDAQERETKRITKEKEKIQLAKEKAAAKEAVRKAEEKAKAIEKAKEKEEAEAQKIKEEILKKEKMVKEAARKAEEKADAETKAIIEAQKNEKVETLESMYNEVSDINITREKEDAKRKADKLLRDAMREMG